MMIRSLLAAAVLVGGAAGLADAAEPAPAMAAAAKAFLETLTPTQRAEAVFPFDSDERLNWHFIPKDKTRKGLKLKSMNEAQKKAALALLATGLSESAFKTATVVRSLESVLARLEGPNRNNSRDPELYHFSIFGTPSTTKTWGWRYEGHHASLNYTVVNGKVIAGAPQFFGSNPAEVRDGKLKGTRALADEEDLARAVLASLTAEQRAKAVISDTAPRDILTSADRTAAMQENKGVRLGELNREQRGKIRDLIRAYARIQPGDVAQKRMAAVRAAGTDDITFAWMGGLKRGEGHYYRVQGKTFLIEYDNTQNGANHIHSVWRDFKGDFGRDLLAMHYRLYPHGPATASAEKGDRPTRQIAGNQALQTRLAVLSGQTK